MLYVNFTSKKAMNIFITLKVLSYSHTIRMTAAVKNTTVDIYIYIYTFHPNLTSMVLSLFRCFLVCLLIHQL